ncbi:YjgN family protein [Ciceribacter selenitireducens]
MTETRPVSQVTRGEFRGQAGEYFGIWIVNILLTIVTLGIYSAWAKVRRNRYFYGNSFVDNHSFDYHARGLQILIGRAIVFVFFVVVQVVSVFYPLAGIVVPFVVLLALPWLLSRGLRFSARVTSYRNVRFDFKGTPWGAFVSVILGGLVAFFSLGLLAPLASRWLYRYVFNNLRYGDRSFATDPRIGKLYRAWVPAIIVTLIGAAIAVGLGVMIYVASGAMDDAASKEGIALRGIAMVYGTLIPLLFVYAIAAVLYRVGVRNVVMNATLLDGRHRLFSDMGRLRYLWIVVSNLLVTVLTLGLMRPWAAVREQRYVVGHSGMIIDGDIGDVVASIEASGSAVTAEYLDMEGFDFGF